MRAIVMSVGVLVACACQSGDVLPSTAPLSPASAAFAKATAVDRMTDVKAIDAGIAEQKTRLASLRPTDVEARGGVALRLADLYRVRARLLRVAEEKAWRAAHQQWQATSTGHEPDRDQFLAESDAYFRQVLANYRIIADKMPGYSRQTEVLFKLGMTLVELDQKALAQARLSTLVRADGRSIFAPAAWLWLGDAAQADGRTAEAKAAWRRAADEAHRLTMPEVEGPAHERLKAAAGP